MTDAIPGLSPNMNPAEPGTPVTPPAEPLTGLDKFNHLFDNTNNDDPKADPKAAPETPFDPMAILGNEEAVTDLLSKVDFSKNLSPETQELIAKNDPGALLALTNDVGKQGYIQALQHGVMLNKRYVDEQLAKQSTDVTSKINTQIADRELAALLPEINNPLVAAGITSFKDAYIKQNPTASAQDVANQIKTYMGDLNNTINKPAPTPSSEEPVDWLDGLIPKS